MGWLTGEGGGGLVDPCKAWVPPPSLYNKCLCRPTWIYRREISHMERERGRERKKKERKIKRLKEKKEK